MLWIINLVQKFNAELLIKTSTNNITIPMAKTTKKKKVG